MSHVRLSACLSPALAPKLLMDFNQTWCEDAQRYENASPANGIFLGQKVKVTGDNLPTPLRSKEKCWLLEQFVDFIPSKPV